MTAAWGKVTITLVSRIRLNRNPYQMQISGMESQNVSTYSQPTALFVRNITKPQSSPKWLMFVT